MYKHLIDLNNKVSFITFGKRDDLKFKDRLGGINILCNHYNLPDNVYSSLIHLIHWKTFINCDIIKTNQTSGFELALKASKFWKKPLIGRMGYIFSDNRMYNKGAGTASHNFAFDLEKKLLEKSNKIVVTSDEIKKRLKIIHNLKDKKNISIIPNFVDTNVFKPSEDNIKKSFDLIFIGRIEKEKNIEQLLIATVSLKAKLLIIGKGSLKKNLMKKYNSPLIKWISKVENKKLPKFLNQARVFILPSLHEGHPKSLIEAMSCGCLVIGAKSPGIKSIINDGVNGILCGTNSNSLIEKISFALSDLDLSLRLGNRAREDVKKLYSLEKIIKLELDVYENLIK